MSLNLLGQYDSDSEQESESELLSVKQRTDKLDTHHSSANTIKVDEDMVSKSYFADDFSDASSSPESSETDESDGNELDKSSLLQTQSLPLPEFHRIHSGKVEPNPGSVFSNPYKEAEDAKLAILQKHVALASAEDKDEKRKFRRRRRQKPVVKEGDGNFDEHDSSLKRNQYKRVKSGLSDGLVPSQKYMKFHKQVQAKERPWTLKHQ